LLTFLEDSCLNFEFFRYNVASFVDIEVTNEDPQAVVLDFVMTPGSPPPSNDDDDDDLDSGVGSITGNLFAIYVCFSGVMYMVIVRYK